MAAAEFWYEFASTYSYPAAMRVADLAQSRGVALAWQPFLLGPIFAAQGWRDSPFNIYPAKGRYMWRDMKRICDALGLPPLKRPVPFPQNSLLAARVALALDDATRADFSRAVYAAEFGQGLPIADRAVIAALLVKRGLDAETVLARAEGEANKAALKAECARAAELGIIGAPSLVTGDGEVFWGNDRLEQGLDWAAGRRLKQD
jgi:2-hydroxychromene-2-carboxylate isomerase